MTCFLEAAGKVAELDWWKKVMPLFYGAAPAPCDIHGSWRVDKGDGGHGRECGKVKILRNTLPKGIVGALSVIKFTIVNKNLNLKCLLFSLVFVHHFLWSVPKMANKQNSERSSQKVKQGDRVSVHYTGKTQGKVFDTSKGREPLQFTVGTHEVIKGFDQAIDGMAVGESKTITIPPEEAYGTHMDKMVVKIPRQAIKLDAELKPGMRLEMTDPEGHMRILTIVAIEGDAVTVDLNHPLAGKTLEFELEVVKISDNTQKIDP